MGRSQEKITRDRLILLTLGRHGLWPSPQAPEESYFSPITESEPVVATVPHAALVPQAALVPHAAELAASVFSKEVPHAALVPHAADEAELLTVFNVAACVKTKSLVFTAALPHTFAAA